MTPKALNSIRNALSIEADPPVPAFDAAARREHLLAQLFRTEQGRAVTEHWLDIAGDRLLPRKSDLDPSRMKELLPFLMIYEYRSTDEIIFRLFGTSFYGAYKRDLTGTNYLDLVRPDLRRQTGERLHRILAQPCGINVVLNAPAGREVRGLYEAISLPLLGNDGRVQFSIHSSAKFEGGIETDGSESADISFESADYLNIGAGIPDLPPFG